VRVSIRPQARQLRGIVLDGIRFTSELPLFRRAELERLVYFNKNQHKVEARLLEALRLYGSPSMVLGERLIRFSVSKVASVQTLYAFDESRRFPRLAAVAIYTREDIETLTVIFVAVHEDYVAGGPHEGKLLAPRVLELLRASAARTKGVRWLRLLYHPRDLRIPMRKT
jgi:hypothetical protein